MVAVERIASESFPKVDTGALLESIFEGLDEEQRAAVIHALSHIAIGFLATIGKVGQT